MEPIMPEEKHAESSGLKNKLEELSTLPGESPMDKNLAWDKLHLLLHKSQNRNIKIWYWAAAACLVISLIMASILETNKTGNPVNSHAANAVTQHRTNPEQLAKKQNPILRDETVSNNEKGIQKIIEKKQGRSVIAIQSEKNNHSIVRSNISLWTAKPESAQVLMVSHVPTPPLPQAGAAISLHDPATTKTNPFIAKGKLRVVHVNELDEPPPEDHKWVRNSGRLSLQLQLIGQNIPQNNYMESGHSENGILKISLPSSN